jgi:acyl-homoserine lactone synthase
VPRQSGHDTPATNVRTIVLTAADLERHRSLIDQAFALRHRVFVEGRGWEILRRPDQLDIDHHDLSNAIHILALDGNELFGYTRLVPGGFFLAAKVDLDRVPQLPPHTLTYGLSRFCIEPARRRHSGFDAGIAALMQTVGASIRKYNIDALMFETDPSLIFVLKVLGFKIKIIGDAAPLAGRLLVPTLLQVDEETLSGLPAKIARWRRLGISPPTGSHGDSQDTKSAASAETH